jgi:hypothetical protein
MGLPILVHQGSFDLGQPSVWNSGFIDDESPLGHRALESKSFTAAGKPKLTNDWQRYAID